MSLAKLNRICSIHKILSFSRSCVHTVPTLALWQRRIDIHCLGQLESVCSLLRCVVWAINKHLVSDNLLPCQRAPPWHSAGDWTLTQTAPHSEYQCCVLRVFIPQLSTRELICHTREYYIHTREYSKVVSIHGKIPVLMICLSNRFPCAPREYDFWVKYTGIKVLYTGMCPHIPVNQRVQFPWQELKVFHDA